MDPLSITSASVALAAAVYKCTIEVKKIVGTIADAADSLSDLAEEAQLIQGALQGVEDALQDNQEAISRYKVEEVFSIAVKGCRATLACIKQEFELLFNRSDWKARFMVLWKEDDMKKLLGRLDRKRESILLLLQLLSLSSVREVQALVAKKQSALTVAKEDITALIPTYWSCRDTILDSLDKETVDSIYADWENRESKLSTTEFDFDYELINTRAYRRALAQAQAKRSRELPRRELDTPAREPNAGIIEPVEDLIDLTSEPSQQTASMPLHMPPKSYSDLAGLQFMPITADERSASAGSLETSETAEPIDMRGMTDHLRESDMSPESRDKSPQNRMPGIRRWHQTTTKEAVTEIRQDETQHEEALTGRLAQTMYRNSNSLSAGLSIARHLPSSKSHDSLDIEYFDALKGHSGPSGKRRPGVRVRITPSKRKGVVTKHHPEVTETSPDSRIPWDELLDGSPMGSSRAPNIGDSIFQKGPVDIEIDRGHRRRRAASPPQATKIVDELPKVRMMSAKNAGDSKYEPYDSGYIPDDDMRPRSRNIARRSRPKAKQSQRSKSTDSTEANAGPPPNINNPRLLKTVEDAIQRLILPELKALKRETAQRRRPFTGAEARVTSALAESNEKEKGGENKREASSLLHSLDKGERNRNRFNREWERRERS
ncbi:hypothetical protein NOF04DRAFT_5704 [Fusarium oxysporum II5]|uniref:Fungal N-terminal domain-containing protein n=2 Tax=Fusarium oxysporum f. sp. cubense (strain race 4) TaxID=2502994 RepID=N1RXD9_FUSC4|nr:uncharacterized protein FOIG_09000 [Fusarium odoratissimum NRRL 54006]EMT70534.1 hypothetical protein FOC4_g10008997 [Fusarium odoratissimum]EXL99121.1 hypothetical protein FOIG_09000 [Fusarium odoratissimum NRRL 54006]KAK2130359.1 hypothetical protein NOF04DRAFT_5704 [Fusarium oxysporum II5]